MKDYLQPAATFALALALASLPFTVPQGVRAFSDYMDVGVTGTLSIDLPGYVDVRGCN